MGIYKEALTYCEYRYWKGSTPTTEERDAAVKRVIAFEVRRKQAQEPKQESQPKLSVWTKIRRFLGLL